MHFTRMHMLVCLGLGFKRAQGKKPWSHVSLQLRGKKTGIIRVVCVQQNGYLLWLFFIGKTTWKTSTEIYFLQDKNKKKKKGELTKRRRHFLLEKHLDGNGPRSSKAMGAAQRSPLPGAGICLDPASAPTLTHLLILWIGKKHSPGSPKWAGNGFL